MATAGFTDAEFVAEPNRKLTASTVLQLLGYIEHAGHVVPDDKKTDKIFLKKLAGELVTSGNYNLSPFKLKILTDTSSPKRHDVAVKLPQQSTQNFDFEKYLKLTKIENEKVEGTRRVEREIRDKVKLKLRKY